MNETYPEWIDRRYPTSDAARNQCSYATTLMTSAYPELIRVRGWYNPPGYYPNGRGREHWWCKTADGTIVDPTARQFRPGGVYREFKEGTDPEPIGKCMNCGDECWKVDPDTYAPNPDPGVTTSSCCTYCALELEAYYRCKLIPDDQRHLISEFS